MALKDIPQEFHPDSESDLLFAVARFFVDLGFEPGEMSFEDRFTIHLGHNSLVVERPELTNRGVIAGRSDLLLTRNRKPIAIVETKAPNNQLTNEDAFQALSYARLLLEMPPFAIVTNGKDTRVYDTFATQLLPLDSPISSIWQVNGQQIPSIGDDLRYEAARVLIGINPQTLESFCRTQTAHGMEDLRGTIGESKKYVPELYLARLQAMEAFRAWQATDLPCFAVIGESGVGKTSLLCAIAERTLQDNFVLFYPASNLHSGLANALSNDFVWEFHRERSISYIVDRFDGIARRSGKRFVMFVDGIDEYPGDRLVFKTELLDWAYRLRGRSVRLCLSCKSFDWSDFVLDRGQTFNTLAKGIYPARDSVLHPSTPQAADARDIGVWLSKFTEDELNQAFPKYRAAFSLDGELQGEMRTECQMPLMLRFVAESYRNTGRPLPRSISSQEIFDMYWDRKLGEIDQRIAAEQILTTLATISVETATRQVSLANLRNGLPWTDALQKAYEDLIRLGLIVISRDRHGFESLSFEFEKMRSYVYTVRAKLWPISPPEEVAAQICGSLGNLLMVEAIEFYLVTIDRGETAVLTKVALSDLDCFVALMSSLDLNSSVTEQMSADRQRDAMWNRLQQYAASYSDISRTYFPELCDRIEPYRTGPVGVWVSGSAYQFRTRTQAYPDPVLSVSGEIAGALFHQTLPANLYSEILPGGTISIGFHEIVARVPQKTAWDRIEAQIGDLFEYRFLDESSSPAILNERVWDTVAYQPSIWMENTPVRQRFWQLLHFSDSSELASVPLHDLKHRVTDLISEFATRIPPRTREAEDNPTVRWYLLETQQLLRLFHWISLLEPHQERLSPPAVRREDLFQYVRSQTGLKSMIPVVELLIPEILAAHHSLLTKNFSRLEQEFPVAGTLGSPLVVQISHQAHHGDFLTLGYMFLPSMRGSMRDLTVWVSSDEQDVYRGEFTRTTPKGSVTITGAGFGRGQIEIVTDTVEVHESDGVFCSTRFPSQTPILDQAYQILANEAEYILRGRSQNWANVDTGIRNFERLDHYILRNYRLPMSRT